MPWFRDTHVHTAASRLVVIACLVIQGAAAWAHDLEMLSLLEPLADNPNCSRDVDTRLEEFKRLTVEGHFPSERSEEDTLRAVNLFFYRHVRIMPDSRAWSRDEYWATPLETLCTGNGDTEDVAIAKYFTLAEMGVSQRRLRLTYADSSWFGPAIVLLYRRRIQGNPGWVLFLRDVWSLDDVRKKNLFEPVYGFNTETFWMVNARWRFTRIHDKRSIRAWRRILRAMRIDDNR